MKVITKARRLISAAAASVLLAACENPLFIQSTGLHKVEFSTDGGSAVGSLRTDRINSAPQTAKENCEFEGWYESSDFREAAVVFPFDVREDMTLYAKWLQKYTVAFDTGGGTAVASVTAHTISAPPRTPEKDGFTFGGWYMDGALSEAAAFPLELDGDTTLYAKWLKNFTVIFEANGGTAVAPITAAVIESLPKPVRGEEYEFAGWYASPSCAGSAAEEPYSVTADAALYAKWLPTYLVTLEADGGSGTAPFRARTLEGVPAPERAGFTFLGWYMDGALSEAAEFPQVLSRDTTFYAKWAQNFTVTFEVNGGSAVPAREAARIEESPATALDGKMFAGWYADAGLSDESKIAFPYDVARDITLYAKWTAEMYAITYDANGADGGTVPERVLVEKGGLFTVSANTGGLVKNGYAFTTWSASADGASGQTYAAGQTVAPSKNLTLYAQWGTDYGAMADVAGGTFKMGDPDSASRPTITLSGFRIAKYELTYELWLEVATWARQNGYTLADAKKGYAANDEFKSFVPATNFSWNMACVWLNAYSEYKGLEPAYYRGSSVWRDDTSTSGTFKWDRTKNGFRLPTECEWEYAAGGGSLAETRTIYSGSNNIDDVAWYYDSSGEAHPVGTKKPNQLGIYDMSGSAAEWCYDYYASYGTGELTNPVHEGNTKKVYRGGSFGDSKTYCTIYYRSYFYDAYDSLGRRSSESGIRVAQNAAQ
ncbi:MAG: InlB B-repeat-containing protein [Treponemataceae bacterium]|nr:InlB B-repeat-containing protein [Treponemataceae bacterium]